jgi:hypothetical protein
VADLLLGGGDQLRWDVARLKVAKERKTDLFAAATGTLGRRAALGERMGAEGFHEGLGQVHVRSSLPLRLAERLTGRDLAGVVGRVLDALGGVLGVVAGALGPGDATPHSWLGAGRTFHGP